MKDIRIITGKDIRPDAKTALALAGYGNTPASQQRGLALFAELERPVRQAVRLKAALAFADDGHGRMGLYAVMTAGAAVSRMVDAYIDRKEYTEAVLFNAMADSCLFAFEHTLGGVIRSLCTEAGYGVSCRHEAGMDASFSLQERALQAVDASRTLGVSLTEGRMLQPEKTLAVAYELTEDTAVFHWEQDCQHCANANCVLRKNAVHERRISCPKGICVSQWLRQQGMQTAFPCGERGLCGKCCVRVVNGHVDISPEDRMVFSEGELAAGWRLSCRAVPQEDIAVILPVQQQRDMAALGQHHADMPISEDHSYGLAVDLGTTTLAVSLVDMVTKQVVYTATAANSQRACGADVISRIQAAENGKADWLKQLIRHDLHHIFQQIWTHYPQAKQRCRRAAVAGNTTMMHLLMGWDCAGLGSWPFHPVSLGGCWYPWVQVFGEMDGFSAQPVALLPGISTYVGSDIAAGIWKCHLVRHDRTALFVDLGTNGEMALQCSKGLFTAATAAGPALEGGSIQWGTASVPGAICNVTVQGIRAHVQTIGSAPPSGICGTGVVEGIAELVRNGMIDHSGMLCEPYFYSGFPLASAQDGRSIVITQKDIREIQLAKSAIRAGMETLLHEGHVSYADVDQVYIAGGFGYFLNIAKAAAIGLLPPQLQSCATAVGNTSLAGAATVVMDEGVLDDMKRICRCANEILLANNDFFQTAYIRYMNF